MKNKKFISLLLTILMSVSMLISFGTSAFAVENPDIYDISYSLGMAHCPYCEEELNVKWVDTGNHFDIFKITDPCPKCDRMYDENFLVQNIIKIAKDIDHTIDDKTATQIAYLLNYLCPDCHTHKLIFPMSFTGTVPEGHIVSDHYYCSCGFDITKYPQTEKKVATIQGALFMKQIEYSSKYPDYKFVSNSGDVPPEETTVTTTTEPTSTPITEPTTEFKTQHDDVSNPYYDETTIAKDSEPEVAQPVSKASLLFSNSFVVYAIALILLPIISFVCWKRSKNKQR